MKPIFTKGEIPATVFILVIGMLLLPLMVHNTYGSLTFVNYQWFAELFPKINWDYQKMLSAYGLDAANDFRTFFITTLIFNIGYATVFLVFFAYQIANGGLNTGVGFTRESGRKSKKSDFLNTGAFLAIFASVTLIVPSPIAQGAKWGFLTIKPSLKSEFLVSIAFLFTSYLTAALVAEVLNVRSKNNDK